MPGAARHAPTITRLHLLFFTSNREHDSSLQQSSSLFLRMGMQGQCASPFHVEFRKQHLFSEYQSLDFYSIKYFLEMLGIIWVKHPRPPQRNSGSPSQKGDIFAQWPVVQLRGRTFTSDYFTRNRRNTFEPFFGAPHRTQSITDPIQSSRSLPGLFPHQRVYMPHAKYGSNGSPKRRRSQRGGEMVFSTEPGGFSLVPSRLQRNSAEALQRTGAWPCKSPTWRGRSR
jgi:hypothetical protein